MNRTNVSFLEALALIVIAFILVCMGMCEMSACQTACGPLGTHVVHHGRGSECLCVDADGRLVAPRRERP